MSTSSIETEISTLKSAFCYFSYRIDLDFLLDDLDRLIFSDEHLVGRSIFQVASDLVLDAYYDANSLEPLVKIYSAQGFRTIKRFDRLLGALEKNSATELIELFWRNITRVTLNEYRFQLAGRAGEQDKQLKQYRSYTEKCYQAAVQHLNAVGNSDAANRLTNIVEALDSANENELPPPTRNEKIDEALFWSLIDQTRNAPDINTQILNLCDQLLCFKSVDIKRFIAIYTKQVRSLYHWNVWALAYACRGGCSDTTFELFRDWLILQGSSDLLKKAIKTPHVLVSDVPKDPTLPADKLILNLLNVYFRREKKTLDIPELDLDKPKGRVWSEQQFNGQFPELSKHYDLI